MILEKEAILSAGLLVKVVLGAMVGYIMHRVKKIENKTEDSMSREEVRELIDDKIKPIEVMHKDLKEDTKEIAQKLDKLLDYMLANK